MHEFVVKFGFGDRGLVYQTVMEGGSPRQAELAFRRWYFRESSLRVRGVIGDVPTTPTSSPCRPESSPAKITRGVPTTPRTR